jgi:hypothetical protein
VLDGPGDRPALSLLHQPEATLAELEALVYQGRALVETPWEELVADDGRQRARAAAAQLGWSAEQEGLTDHADLAALLEIVEDGHGTRLSGRFMGTDAPESLKRASLVTLLTHTVENALVERHHRRHVSDENGEPILVDDAGSLLPVRDLVVAAVHDPSQVEPLRRWAGERGLLRVHRTLDDRADDGTVSR